MQREIPQPFLKKCIIDHLYTQKHICIVKGVGIWVFSYGCFKLALSFLRIV